jgi:tetratricopeptide (TPR) repeat protein
MVGDRFAEEHVQRLMPRLRLATIVGLLHATVLVAFGASLPGAADLREHARAARASLQAGRLDLAMRQASAAHLVNPKDAGINSLLGDIAYRKADFDNAESFYRSALAAEGACARALWGLGRIEELNFRRGAARDYFSAAFRLAPRDPQILRSYASVVTDRQAEVILLKNYIAAGGEDPESALGRLQLRERIGARAIDILATPYQGYTLQMAPYFPASARAAGLVLTVSINEGKPLRLVFDTGAKGILIRDSAARKLELEFLGPSLVRGLGKGEAAKAWIGLAQSLRIENLRMRNCLIEVSGGLPPGDADGVIGAAMFQRFLIRFNAGEKLLELTPFPDAGVFNAERPWHGHNRAVERGAEQFSRARQAGHLILVGAGSAHFLVDTGAAYSALPAGLAGDSLRSSAIPVYGLSGRAAGAVRASPVQFQIGRESVVDTGAIALDLEPMSRQEGVEISGLIGYPALCRGVLTINYRDGLIDFAARK